MPSFHLRVSALLMSLSPGLYAQAPAPADAAPEPSAPAAAPATASAAAPATAPAAAAAPAPAPAAAPAAAPATTPDASPTRPAPASDGAVSSPPRQPAQAATRRRTSPNVSPNASLAGPLRAEQLATASNDPSIDRHEPPSAPARPIPLIAVWLGVGNLWIPSDGLDPFAEDDALTTFNAGAGFSLAQAGALDVAAVAVIDVGGSEAAYRGEDTSLGLLRLAVGPELRGSWLDRLYWHGRLAPTLTRLSVELEESSSGATLADTRWLWGAEAAAGLEVRFAHAATSLPHALGFFLRADVGYGWTPGAALELGAEGSSAPVRTQPLALGELALHGPFFRANAGVGF